MKRFLLNFVLISLLLTSSVYAETIKVISLEKFSTENPSPTYTVKTVEREEFKNGTVIEAGTIISGKVIRVQQPQRGKRNGYFVFLPTSATYEGTTRTTEKPMVAAKVVGYRPIEPQKAAIYVARKATNLFFKGASIGIAFVEGVAQAEEGEKIKTGLVSAYKDSPLSYIEVGSDLNVEVGDMLILKFKKIR